jgi:hypothetical protein
MLHVVVPVSELSRGNRRYARSFAELFTGLNFIFTPPCMAPCSPPSIKLVVLSNLSFWFRIKTVVARSDPAKAQPRRRPSFTSTTSTNNTQFRPQPFFSQLPTLHAQNVNPYRRNPPPPPRQDPRRNPPRLKLLKYRRANPAFKHSHCRCARSWYSLCLPPFPPPLPLLYPKGPKPMLTREKTT